MTIYPNFLSKAAPWIIALLAVVSRLPQLCSPLLLMDGDECIVGLMAKHFYEGKELPLYFWGQSYGFSFVEVLFIAMFYLFLGPTALAVKLGALTVWTIGMVFFYKSLKNWSKGGSVLPFLITLVFIFSPVWAVWSMKARGGYVTAFLFSNIALYLFSQHPKKTWQWALLGFTLVITGESQGLWMPGLFPFVIYGLYKNWRWKNLFAFANGILLPAVGFYFVKKDLSKFWSPAVAGSDINLIERAKEIPDMVFQNMTGSYDYTGLIDMGRVTNSLAHIFTALVFLGLTTALYFAVRKKPYVILYLSGISVLLTLAYLFKLNGYTPRYLLPLAGFVTIMLHEIIRSLNKKIIFQGLLGLWTLVGGISLYQFKDHRFEWQDASQLKELCDVLNAKGVQHVFCRHALLQWQIMFYSQERVKARYSTNTDRRPETVESVNEAFRTKKPVAAVDFFYHTGFEASDTKMLVAHNAYWVHFYPTEEELKDYGFEMKDRGTE